MYDRQPNKPTSDQKAYEDSLEPGEVLFETGDEIEPVKLKYLWPGVIPVGCLTFFVGEAGKGKSTFAVDIAARVSGGMEWPNSRPKNPKYAPRGNVLVLAGEDDKGMVIVPKIIATGGVRRRFIFPKGIKTREGLQRADLQKIFAKCESSLEKKNLNCPKLIIVDPLNDYMTRVDMNTNNTVREALLCLRDFAQKKHVAVIVIHHFNKDTKRKARYRLTGSSALREMARAVFVFEHSDNRDDPFTMRPDKNNYQAPEEWMGFDFKIDTTEVSVGDKDITTAKIVSTSVVRGQSADASEIERLRKESQTRKAAKWLAQQKFVKAGTSIRAGEIQQTGLLAGYSPRVLGAARDRLGIKTKKVRGKNGTVEEHLWIAPSQ